MSRNQDDLLRGQGLAQNARTGANARLKIYVQICAGLTLLGATTLTVTLAPPNQLSDTASYTLATTVRWATNDKADPVLTLKRDGRRYPALASRIVAHPYFAYHARAVKVRAMLGGLLGLLAGVAGCYAYAGTLRKRGIEAARDKIISGTKIVTQDQLAKLTQPSANAASLHIADIAIPASLECRHFALLGTTGAGKTTVLRQMLDAVEARGEPAIIYDTSGDMVSHYYSPERGDIILNPFDARSAYWSPFAEIAHPADADRIAHQLVTSTGKADDDVWLETARILVANILRALKADGKTSLHDLLDALQVKTKDELKHWLAGTSSARTFEDDADRATASVLFMLAKASNLLQFLIAEPGERPQFAFRDFIAGLDACHGPIPWIFVPRKEDYFEAVKPLLACWLECAASATLGLLPSPTRRLWFFLDELADLPRVDNLARLLPEGRKFGAAVVLTFQSIGQMHNRYGRDSGEAMLGCCNSKLYLQLIDRDTREWASKTIGDVEVEYRNTSDNFDLGQSGGDNKAARMSLGTTRQVRPAILESELRLPPYHGILQLPDALPVARIKLTNAHIISRGSPKHLGFVAADIGSSLWGRLPSGQGSASLPDEPNGNANSTSSGPASINPRSTNPASSGPSSVGPV